MDMLDLEYLPLQKNFSIHWDPSIEALQIAINESYSRKGSAHRVFMCAL